MTVNQHTPDPDEGLAALLDEWAAAAGVTWWTSRTRGTMTSQGVQREDLRQLVRAVRAAERDRWAAIAKSHMDTAAAMGAREKARTAASILSEGMS